MNRPLKIGLTGGIGTGKTTVAKIFETFGIPVLYADNLAKELMQTDVDLIQNLKNTFGENIYNNGILDRQKLSNIVFKDNSELEKLNTIVHPAVKSYGKKWMDKQKSPYAIKEAAIMIESGSHLELDFLIGVTTPKEILINRVMKRDNITREAVLERMSKQMDNDEKMKLCDAVIINDDSQSLIEQCHLIHERLLNVVSL